MRTSPHVFHSGRSRPERYSGRPRCGAAPPLARQRWLLQSLVAVDRAR